MHSLGWIEDRDIEHRVAQLNLTPEIEVFYMAFLDQFLLLVWHLSNSIWNTSISGVKSIWTLPVVLAEKENLGWSIRSGSGLSGGRDSLYFFCVGN